MHPEPLPRSAVVTGRTFGSFREIADFLWQNAERLRGVYKPNEYDGVILPMLVVRRLDCVLAPTKDKVLKRLDDLKARGHKPADAAVDVALRKVAGVPSGRSATSATSFRRSTSIGSRARSATSPSRRSARSFPTRTSAIGGLRSSARCA